MRIAIVGDYNPSFPPHPATGEALCHAAVALGMAIDVEWLPTDSIGPSAATRLPEYDGLWIAPGSPYQNLAGALGAIRFARENGIPLLGTCGGLQHMILEFARNVLGIRDAAHAEYDPYASPLVVTRLDCSLVGKQMPIEVVPGSLRGRGLWRRGGGRTLLLQFWTEPGLSRPARSGGPSRRRQRAHRRGPNPGNLATAFFVGTLFVPQVRSTAGQPHPLAMALLRAAAGMPGTDASG